MEYVVSFVCADERIEENFDTKENALQRYAELKAKGENVALIECNCPWKVEKTFFGGAEFFEMGVVAFKDDPLQTPYYVFNIHEKGSCDVRIVKTTLTIPPINLVRLTDLQPIEL